MARTGKFAFDAVIEKAERQDDRLFITAVASDTGADKHDDRFSEKAIHSMATQATARRLPLLPTHFDTFSIGHSVHGEARRVGNAAQFVVKLELKGEYPQAEELYKEVESGDCDKQLSIGGKLKIKDPKAIEWEVAPDGRTFLRVLNAIELDHIAVTRKDHAANPRTAFLDAVKAVYDEAVEDIRSAHGESAPDAVDKSGAVTAPPECVPWAATETAHPLTPWDSEAAFNTISGVPTLVRAASLWSKTDKTGTRFRGLHHTMVDGSLKTVLSGIGLAAHRMLRNAAVRAEERVPCALHLCKHYEDFGVGKFAPTALATADVIKDHDADLLFEMQHGLAELRAVAKTSGAADFVGPAYSGGNDRRLPSAIRARPATFRNTWVRVWNETYSRELEKSADANAAGRQALLVANSVMSELALTVSPAEQFEMQLDMNKDWRPAPQDYADIEAFGGKDLLKAVSLGFEKNPHRGLLARVTGEFTSRAVVKSLGAVLGAAETLMRDAADVGLEADDLAAPADTIIRSLAEFKIPAFRTLVELAAGEACPPWAQLEKSWNEYVAAAAPQESVVNEPNKAADAAPAAAASPAAEDPVMKALDALRAADPKTLTDVQKNALRELFGASASLAELAGLTPRSGSKELPTNENTKADTPADAAAKAVAQATAEGNSVLEAAIRGLQEAVAALTAKVDGAAATTKSGLDALTGRVAKIETMEGVAGGDPRNAPAAAKSDDDSQDDSRITGVLGLARYRNVFSSGSRS